MKADMRSAFGTGIRLSMKAPIRGVVVFSLAGRTHPKMPHGGPGTVIGNVIDDGVARSAIGAIYKRIQIAPITGIEKLAQAVITN